MVELSGSLPGRGAERRCFGVVQLFALGGSQPNWDRRGLVVCETARPAWVGRKLPPMDDASALAARSVSKRFGSILALDGVSLDVRRGECVALIGESGSGKTTLLRCFNRLTDPDKGQVLVDGTDVASLDPVGLRRRVGYVPQDGGLLPHWRVRRNAALVPWLRGAPDANQQADRALGLVGLDPAAMGDRWPRDLSGGQRQRVAVARALAASPDIVLLDEPFGALDAITRADLQAAFRALRRELGVTTVLVTHDLAEAELLADRIAVMHQGRVEQVAAPGELHDAPATDYVRALLARARVRG
jgi:osmoprotectant transport system ATP-binding protein